MADKKDTHQDYEKPNVPGDVVQTEDVYDQYMELEDPKFAGYVNQPSN